jgi:cytochrome c nitrite reductase small subunit
MPKVLKIVFSHGRLVAAGTTKSVVLGGIFGLLLGVGAFTFNYAEGFSYLSADPKACVNCHIMRSEYDSWQKSSHHAAAKCVDCHLPHDLLGKYIAKGVNGYHHSKGFTFQDFHEPIMIKTRNSQILQDNCLRCHEDMVHDLVVGIKGGPEPVYCVHCHQSIGHGEPAGMGRSYLSEPEFLSSSEGKTK